MNTLEIKIVEQLNNKHYRQHGDKLFDIANTEINSNQNLFCSMNLYTLQPRSMTISLLNLVKYLMQDAMNFYAIGKLSCIENSKVIDGSVSLRDELKVYALNKIIN